MKEVFIVSAKRTAIGSFLGSLSGITAPDLGKELIKYVLEANSLPTNAIDEVILGQVLTGGQGQNPARQTTVKAGLDISTPAYTVNMVCGSGLKSVALGYNSIVSGDAELVLCGGQESMSNALHGMYVRQGIKMGDSQMVDLLQKDGLVDAFDNISMGITAENLAKNYNLTREQQDEYALNSQLKAAKARNEGKFSDEILPIKVKIKKEEVEFKNDEFIRAETTAESLAKLRPAFLSSGTVTAGNSSGINDGAAVLLLASGYAVKKYNLKPLVKVTGHSSCGVDPKIMGIGPVATVNKLIKKLNCNLSDFDLIEANEAFAAQSLAVTKELDLNRDIVNVNGGAIALGHPIGASGARVAVTLIHEMMKRNSKRGLATLCIGGGMGVAVAFEKI